MTDAQQTPRRGFRVIQGGAGRPVARPSDAPPADAVDVEVKLAPLALGPGREGQEPPAMSEETGRRLAPGAPLSPGTAPLELAVHLRVGEPLVWWDAKSGYDLRPAVAVLVVCALVLLGASALAPGFWRQEWADLWPPIAALLSPVVLLLARERMSQRSLLVTDTALVEVTRGGAVSRLAFSAVRKVRRDLVTGGIFLQGKDTRIRIPPGLVENARAAIASQRKNVIRGEPTPPDDPLRWMP